jgi:hypothetical protein
LLLALALLLVAACVGAAVGCLMLARRFAPAGGVFTDSDRAAGIFSVLGTSFAVLLAFVIFLSFGTFERAKEKASLEAISISQLFRTAALLPPAHRLQGELVCYARAVVHSEWPAMRRQQSSPVAERWVTALEDTVDGIVPGDARQRAAYAHWFGAEAGRREGRRGRLDEATPFVPTPVWLLLGIGALLVVAYLILYADPAEWWFVQAFAAGAIVATVVSSIAIVWFLDHPYARVSGGLQPTAMRESLAQIRPALERRGIRPPCTSKGA